MVFMDTTTDDLLQVSACERWKYAAFIIFNLPCWAAFTYPLFANWAWGGGWLANLGTNFRARARAIICDFAGSGVVVHSVGGITALAVAMMARAAGSASMSAQESRTAILGA